MNGRIYRSSTKEFVVKLLESNELVKAKALGSLLKGKDSHLVVGDYVRVEKQEGDYLIVEKKKPINQIERFIVREKKTKITASNVDLLVVVTSVSKPKFKRGVIDRYLVRSLQWSIPCVIVFNKMDEWSDQIDLSFECGRIETLAEGFFEVSALCPSLPARENSCGFLELKKHLRSKTAIFVGQSGVGKSQMISALSDGKVQLKSKKIGKSGKGPHTTTWSEIVDFDDFSLIDSPGVRSFSLEDISPDELKDFFPDLQDYFSRCKFPDCSHLPNSHGCSFNELDVSDELRSRFESYQCIFNELKST